MTEMIRRYLRQKASSLGSVLVLVLLALLACVPLNAGMGFSLFGPLAVWLLAVGCVSRDAASGALQMILARPIRRVDYLIGRYLGILAALAVFLCGSVVLAGGFDAVMGRLGGIPNASPFSFESSAFSAADVFLNGALLAALLLLFSTFLRGWGDTLAIILGSLVLNAMEGLGHSLGRPALAATGRILKENLFPTVTWQTVLHGQNVLGEATGRYLLALAVYWTAAALIFSRREFSYGQD